MIAGTAVVTAAATATLLLYDWGAQGQDNVFSSIRPAVRQALSFLYGDSSSDGRQRPGASPPGRQQPPPPH